MTHTPLIDDEVHAATLFAERGLPPLTTGNKRYLVAIVTALGSGRRVALLTHIEYGPAAEAVMHQSCVELSTGTIIAQKVESTVAVPLAQEEIAAAERLVREQLLPILKVSEDFRKKVSLNPLVVVQARQSDPCFGHRLVRMYFSVDGELASPPSALVDLSTETVVPD
jgi:hypothetical protein